jgi:hypothetical protein
MAAENDNDLDEPSWLRQRILCLRDIRHLVSDDQARFAIDQLIEAIAERLKRIERLRSKK